MDHHTREAVSPRREWGWGAGGLRIERDRAPKALNSARIASYNIHIFKWRSPNIYIIAYVFGVMKR